MSTHNICFNGEIRKVYYVDTPSYLELCLIFTYIHVMIGSHIFSQHGSFMFQGFFFFSRSHVLQKVCMYFTYKVRYTNSSTEIPEFPIAPEIALELLMAANFLDC